LAEKIVLIGAGSLFGNRLSVDALSREPLEDATLGLRIGALGGV